MSSRPDAPEVLRRARRAVDEIPEVAIVEDLQWLAESQQWLLLIRIHVDAPSEDLPEFSDWYVLIHQDYPLGEIHVQPAKKRGITSTFQHQARNSASSDPSIPWREGFLCLGEEVARLGLVGITREPMDGDLRLEWHVRRAVEWIRRAAAGELVQKGDPFELPDFRSLEGAPQVAVAEDERSFAVWKGIHEKCGRFEWTKALDGRWTVVKRWMTVGGKSLRELRWGTGAQGQAEKRTGIWLIVPSCPVIRPWHAPSTWGELREALQVLGLNVDAQLKDLVKWVRNEQEPLLALGFSVPRLVGNDPVQMRWQVLKLPPLAGTQKPPSGFRDRARSLWMYDRARSFGDTREVSWLRTENCAEERLRARGRLTMKLCDARVSLVGVGALGSIVAELLIRCGVQRLNLVDGERLEVGNLARHTLTLSDTGRGKAEQMKARLNMISPNAVVEVAIKGAISAKDDVVSIIEGADVVMDLTGSDVVLGLLAAVQVREERTIDWVSASVSLKARRLFFFHERGTFFPLDRFQNAVRPWVALDKETWQREGWIREDAGCHHPASPARMDDMVIAAATVVKLLEKGVEAMDGDRIAGDLVVFEQRLGSENEFCGFERVKRDARVETAPAMVVG